MLTVNLDSHEQRASSLNDIETFKVQRVPKNIGLSMWLELGTLPNQKAMITIYFLSY